VRLGQGTAAPRPTLRLGKPLPASRGGAPFCARPCSPTAGLRLPSPHGRLSRVLPFLRPTGCADAAMSRWVIAAGLKLIVVPVDSTWMRRSLASGSRARASHASRARAGRSRQRQSKWAGSTRRCTRTALVTAPFVFGGSRQQRVHRRFSASHKDWDLGGTNLGRG